MIATRSQTSSTSLSRCELSSTAWPRARSSSSSSRTVRRPDGSSALVGSSSSRTARRADECLRDPEPLLHPLRHLLDAPVARVRRARRARAAPTARPRRPVERGEALVKDEQLVGRHPARKPEHLGEVPERGRGRRPSPHGRRQISAVPSVGRTSPQAILTSVDLPAPFGPSRPSSSPSPTSRSTSVERPDPPVPLAERADGEGGRHTPSVGRSWTTIAAGVRTGDPVSQDRAARPPGGDDPARDAARDREAERRAAPGRHGRGPARPLPVPRLRPLHRGLDPDHQLSALRGRLPAGRRRLRGRGEAARRRLPGGDLLADRAHLARRRRGTRSSSGYCDGAQEARELHGVEVRLTPDITRSAPLDDALALVRHAARYRDRGVVAVGLGGEEAHVPERAVRARLPRRRGQRGSARCRTRARSPGRSRSAARWTPSAPTGSATAIRAIEDPALVEELADRGHRAGRHADLERANRRRRLARGAPAAAARRRPACAARSPPTTR